MTDTSLQAIARSTQNLRSGGHRASFITPADAAGLNAIVDQVAKDQQEFDQVLSSIWSLSKKMGLDATAFDQALQPLEDEIKTRRRAAYATHREYFPNAKV